MASAHVEAAVHLRAPAVLRAWQAILVVGVAVLAISYSGRYSPGGTRLYETWIYEGLELLAALRLPRALRSRARGAPRLVLHRLRPARHDDRRRPLRLLVRRRSAVPVCRRRRVSPLLPAALRRDRPLAPAAGLVQRDPLARRARRRHGCCRARRVGARRGRRQLHARKPAGGAHEHGLSDRGRASARAPRVCLLGDPMAPRPRLGADRRRPDPQHGRRRPLPLPDSRGHLPGGHVSRPRVAAVARPHRARGLAAVRARPACPAPAACASRHADRVRAHRDRSARCGVPAAGKRDHARSRQRDDRARPGPDRAEPLGEHPAARNQP